MGLMFGLILSAMVGYGIYWFIRSSETRRAFWLDFRKAPLYATYTFIWIGFVLLFLWGLLIPIFGNLRFDVAGYQFQIWELGGIGALIMFVGTFFLKEPSR